MGTYPSRGQTDCLTPLFTLVIKPENPQNISKTIPSRKTDMRKKHWPLESKHKYHTKVSKIRGGNKATIIFLQKIPERNSTGTLPVRVGPYYCCRCDIIAWIMSCPIVRRLAGHVLHNITPTASPNFNTIIRGGGRGHKKQNICNKTFPQTMTQTQPSPRPPSPWFGLRYGRGLSPRIRLMSRCLSNRSLTRADGGREAGGKKKTK